MNSPSLGAKNLACEVDLSDRCLKQRPERTEVYAHTRPIATPSLFQPASLVFSLSSLRQESILTPALEPL